MIRDIDPISSALENIGYKLVSSNVGPMDSGAIRYSNGTRKIAISKDRGQWILMDDRKKLEAANLFRAFDDTTEFKNALVSYLNA